MRGIQDGIQESFLYNFSLESVVPSNHPIRVIRRIVDDVLKSMGPIFDGLYAADGRPSIPPEQLLKASILQALFSVRSARQFCEQLRYNLLFRWFLGLDLKDNPWDHSTFSKNKDRLIGAEIGQTFLGAILAHSDVTPLLSDDHFSVDGTLIGAWASQKSFRPKDGSGGSGGSFKGEKRSNDTHGSVTDPHARLYKKSAGSESKLGYLGHAMTENRHGLVVGAGVTLAIGTAEREAALDFSADLTPGSTLGADKAYDTEALVRAVTQNGITPHFAQNDYETKTGKRRKTSISDETAGSEGYKKSQKKRKLIEQAFGWAKTIAGMRQVKVRGNAAVDYVFTIALCAYNLVRLPRLLAMPQVT
jgi:transposase